MVLLQGLSFGVSTALTPINTACQFFRILAEQFKQMASGCMLIFADGVLAALDLHTRWAAHSTE